MNPKGFDFTRFNYPIDHFFEHHWSTSVHSIDYKKVLSIEEETNLCDYNDFTHVYYFIPTTTAFASDGKQMFLIKHKSGYYVCLKVFYDYRRGDYMDGSIYYSKSWDSIWDDLLLEEEKKTTSKPSLGINLAREPAPHSLRCMDVAFGD